MKKCSYWRLSHQWRLVVLTVDTVMGVSVALTRLDLVIQRVDIWRAGRSNAFGLDHVRSSESRFWTCWEIWVRANVLLKHVPVRFSWGCGGDPRLNVILQSSEIDLVTDSPPLKKTGRHSTAFTIHHQDVNRGYRLMSWICQSPGRQKDTKQHSGPSCDNSLLHQRWRFLSLKEQQSPKSRVYTKSARDGIWEVKPSLEKILRVLRLVSKRNKLLAGRYLWNLISGVQQL